MRTRHLFYLLLALPLAFAACEESGDEVKPPVLKLTSEESLSFNADGGMGEITYTLENGVESIKIAVSCEANWVENIVTTNDKITFNVAANEGEARNTQVVVAYSELSFEVAIKQAKSADKPSDSDDNGNDDGNDDGNENGNDDDGNNDDGNNDDGTEDDSNNDGNTEDDDNNNDGNGNEESTYLYEAILDVAKRMSNIEQEWPHHYFAIEFCSNDNSTIFSVQLVGDEGDTLLKAGTYNIGNQGLFLLNGQELCANQQWYTLEKGEVVVTGDYDNGYGFDITLADVDGNLFHFTYKGEVQDMNQSTDDPAEPVTFTAKCLDAYYNNSQMGACLYYTTLSDIGLNEEGYELPGGTYYIVDFHGPESELDEEGYVTIPSGTYTFDVKNTYSEWTFSNMYSQYYIVSSYGNSNDAEGYFEAGTAVVTADGITLSVTIGGIEHIVTYEGAPLVYVGKPEAPPTDGEFLAKRLDGCVYSAGGGINDYYIVLSDNGSDRDGYLNPNSTGYIFDIYGPEATADSEGYITIPAGTYTLDMSGSGELWSIDHTFSYYTVKDSDGNETILNPYDSATVEVTASGITANVVIQGVTHTVVYKDTPRLQLE